MEPSHDGDLPEFAYENGYMYPSETCVDQVLADLGSFDEPDGIDQPYDLVVHGEHAFNTRSSMLLRDAWGLFSYDMGRGDELEESELVSEDFLQSMYEVVDDADTDDLRAALYKYVTSILGTNNGVTSTRFTFQYRRPRTLSVNWSDITAQQTVPVLVREVRHRWKSDLLTPRYWDLGPKPIFGGGPKKQVLTIQ